MVDQAWMEYAHGLMVAYIQRFNDFGMARSGAIFIKAYGAFSQMGWKSWLQGFWNGHFLVSVSTHLWWGKYLVCRDL